MASQAFDERVGANLARIRKTAGWSQADLATKLAEYGLPLQQQTVFKIEHGTRPLRLEEGLAIADVLGVSVNSLAQQFDNEMIAASAAQIQRSNIVIARNEEGIEVIRRQAAQSEKDTLAFIERVKAERQKAEQKLRDAGAVQDGDGRWYFDGQPIDV